jgi:hypothetical protein
MSELRRLVHIANEFNRAAAFKYAGDAESVAKLQSSFSAEDLTRIVELQESLRDTAIAVYRRGGTEAEAEEEMASGWLSLTEIFAKGLLTINSEEDLAAMLPEDARNEETAGAFEKHNAPRLAALCRK